MVPPSTVLPAELRRGCEAFEQHEGRDSMYRVATFLLDQWWGQHEKMTDALTVLLLTWNGAFYRYGPFDQGRLAACLRQHWPTIEDFRTRDIASFGEADHQPLTALFISLLTALQIASGTSRGRRSPVGVAKTLHLLAPSFLPIWDDRIARAYGCHYGGDPTRAYVRFCAMIRDMAAALKPTVPASDKTLLKQIDEFNYAKYTKGWI